MDDVISTFHAMVRAMHDQAIAAAQMMERIDKQFGKNSTRRGRNGGRPGVPQILPISEGESAKLQGYLQP